MTLEQRVQFLLRAPWTVVADPAAEQGKTVLRVQELPEFLVVGSTGDDLVNEFWLALGSLLESYLEDGQDPPLPAGFRLPWARSSGVYNVISVGAASQAQSVGTAGANVNPVWRNDSGRHLVSAGS